MLVEAEGGDLSLDRLRFIRGRDPRQAARGAGLRVGLSGTRFRLTDSSVERNVTASSGEASSAMGGGLYLHLFGGADATVQRTTFRDNVADAQTATGGGAFIDFAGGPSTLLVTGCLFSNNGAMGAFTPANGTSAWGGGLVVSSGGSAHVATIVGNRFVSNLVYQLGNGAAMALWVSGSSTITARRNSVRDAGTFPQGRNEVELRAFGGTLQFSDSEVVNTPVLGISARTGDEGRIFLAN